MEAAAEAEAEEIRRVSENPGRRTLLTVREDPIHRIASRPWRLTPLSTAEEAEVEAALAAEAESVFLPPHLRRGRRRRLPLG